MPTNNRELAMFLPRVRAVIIIAAMLLATSAIAQETAEVTEYRVVHTWPLEKAVQAFDISPAGDFALLSYKDEPPVETRLDIHRFNLVDGTSETIRLSPKRVEGQGSLMIRATAEAKAIAISENGETFLANWPSYIVSVHADSGVMQDVTGIRDAGSGHTMFNVLEFAPDSTAAFGVGSGVVRFDLTGTTGEGIPYSRDVQAPGGQSLAVISATKIATGSSQALTVATTGADAPDCVIDGMVKDLDTDPVGSRLAGAVYDQEANATDMVIWSLPDCQETIRWPTGVSFVPDIAWLPGGERIATAGGDGQLRFWDVETGTQVHSLAVESDAGFKMHFSDDATHLVTFTLWGDRMLRFFESQ